MTDSDTQKQFKTITGQPSTTERASQRPAEQKPYESLAHKDKNEAAKWMRNMFTDALDVVR